MTNKKVFVSGCYDMLHSGHVAFFEEAAKLGDLYVGIGSDSTIQELKNRKTINTENERLYMVRSLKAVHHAWVNSGSGIMDFEPDVLNLRPDIFFVNSDGHSPLKETFCKEHGIQYVISERIPHAGLPQRSTTALRSECRIPYRIDLAGGWLDQPMVSKNYPGPVLTINIEPDLEFNDRSGMSTSSRKRAIELWQTDIPEGDRIKLAKTLFCFENPPGSKYISGSQDALGVVMPGLNRYRYNGDYWPDQIDSVLDNDMLAWIEKHLYMIPLYPRKSSYNVLDNTAISPEGAKALATAAEECWGGLMRKDLVAFGQAMTDSFRAQIAMFPNMVDEEIMAHIAQYANRVKGYKISGAGGGGYLIFASEQPIENSIRIRIRRG